MTMCPDIRSEPGEFGVSAAQNLDARALGSWLAGLSVSGFSPREDLALVEGLAMGRKIPAIAADLRQTDFVCRLRFEVLASTLRDTYGRLPIEAMPLLLTALRARVTRTEAAHG